MSLRRGEERGRGNKLRIFILGKFTVFTGVVGRTSTRAGIKIREFSVLKSITLKDGGRTRAQSRRVIPVENSNTDCCAAGIELVVK